MILTACVLTCSFHLFGQLGNTFLAAVAAGGGDKAASEAKQGNLRESEGEALVRPADLELSEVKVK